MGFVHLALFRDNISIMMKSLNKQLFVVVNTDILCIGLSRVIVSVIEPYSCRFCRICCA